MTREVDAPSTSRGGIFALKLILLAAVNALGINAAINFDRVEQSSVAIGIVIGLVLVDVLYISKRHSHMKYIVPGLLFLVVFNLLAVVYTVSLSFTNKGDGHNIAKPAAIESMLLNSFEKVGDSEPIPVQVLDRDGELFLLVTQAGGSAAIGGANAPLEAAPEAEFANGKAIGLPGYTSLRLADLLGRQEEVTSLEVPVSEDLADGVLRTADTRVAYPYRSRLTYDEERDLIIDTSDGKVYRDNGSGNFESDDGQRLQPGWSENIGLENFRTALGSAKSELVGVLVWNLAFAVSSVVLSFAVGTFVAIAFDDPRLRGRRIYRALMILPYAFPLFLSGLVWSGLLNPSFGFVNQTLLGGADIPWLVDPWLARISVILVSVWFGFPYFFLVTTGALQAIPRDLIEAARVDGAGGWAVFRRVQFPLLLSTTAPLLIAAFAFSFNDFGTIYMLTGGGPANVRSEISAGSTDILITLVYKQAFKTGSGAKDYGLASAFSVLLFLLVAGMSIYLFRRSRRVEESVR